MGLVCFLAHTHTHTHINDLHTIDPFALSNQTHQVHSDELLFFFTPNIQFPVFLLHVHTCLVA
jgi:hypothetical protein